MNPVHLAVQRLRIEEKDKAAERLGSLPIKDRSKYEYYYYS